MPIENFLPKLVPPLVSLAKKTIGDKRLRKSIDGAVHSAFTEYSNKLLILCMDKEFAPQLFRLAEGQTIDAIRLVDIAETSSGLTRETIIEGLKEFALKLKNIFQEITPESGKMPSAFDDFFSSLDRLSILESFSTRIFVDKIHISDESFQRLSEEIGVTRAALGTFFKNLEARHVPPEELDHKLREIAKNYRDLQEKMQFFSSDDPDVTILKKQASAAL